jgi:hypothetical protein
MGNAEKMKESLNVTDETVSQLTEGLSTQEDAFGNLVGEFGSQKDGRISLGDLEYGEYSGKELYEMFSEYEGSDKAASLLLDKHGVPSLRYLDGNSRGKGEGTHNYVV